MISAWHHRAMFTMATNILDEAIKIGNHPVVLCEGDLGIAWTSSCMTPRPSATWQASRRPNGMRVKEQTGTRGKPLDPRNIHGIQRARQPVSVLATADFRSAGLPYQPRCHSKCAARPEPPTVTSPSAVCEKAQGVMDPQP